MKLTLKILKLFAVIFVTLSIVLFSASLVLQDKVADIILKSLNKNISTKLTVKSLKLSFLRKFPKASLALKDVYVHSSSDFSSSQFTGINSDTLLAARFVSVEFSIIDALKGNYNVERISVRSGRINFYTDTSGNDNYNISVNSANSCANNFTINLERINLTDIKVNYNNMAARLIINGQIKNGKIKSRISGNDIDFTSVATIILDSIQLSRFKISRPVEADLDLSLKSSKTGVLFKKGNLHIENYDLGLSGSVSSDNKLDLNIFCHNFDIAKIRNWLPEKYTNLISGYNPSGKLIVNSKINGYLTRKSNPHIEINCLLKEGHISYRKSDLAINDISFAGYFSNGSKNLPETSSVTIKDVRAKLGSAVYTGSFTFAGFDHPRVAILLKGKVFPAEIREFFDLKEISSAGGSVDLDLKLENSLIRKEKYNLSDIIDLKPQTELVFNSFTVGFQNKNILFEQVNGKLSMANNIKARNFQFTYRGQKIIVEGEFTNLPEWLLGRPVQMTASADVSFNRLIPEMFLRDYHSTDLSSKNKAVVNMPGNIVLDLNFKIDSLIYKTFSSSKISGTLNYKSRLLKFISLDMKSLNGMISGNGYIVQNIDKSFITRCNLNLTKIDVNKAFNTFNNFGQKFIKAENINGSLSGSLYMLLPLDSMLNPQIKSLTAEGKYILVNGVLINFDPLKHLSSFIELSELENVSFEQMENNFFIKNNSLYIPQMQVRSSAAELAVSGKHSFDNNYEYHVKMLLSEILSRKRKKNNSNVSEFGVVEDDGLGRTSLLLKIAGKGEEVKVGYDIKAARSELMNKLKSEKQELKSILNQEYGLYKNDPATSQKPAEKNARFKISWGETDSLKTSSGKTAPKRKNEAKKKFKIE